jgi:hypothetical protein
MGLLDSVKSAVQSTVAKVHDAVTPPAQPAPRPTPTGFSPASSFDGGKASPVETPVARRLDREVPMRLYGSAQSERLANLPRLTQIDGNQKSEQDRSTCGVQCVVAALYVNHPEQLTDVAKYLTDTKGEKLDQWAKDCGLDPKQARADLEAIKAGNASPRQISTLSQVLFRDVKDRSDAKLAAMEPLQRKLSSSLPAAGDGGLNRDAIGILTKDILKGECGADPGPLRMSLRDVPGGGRHWVAQVDVATMKDIEENAKKDCVVTFDPAPDPLGLAPTGVAISRRGADTQQAAARGRAVQEITIDSSGAMAVDHTNDPLPPPPDIR